MELRKVIKKAYMVLNHINLFKYIPDRIFIVILYKASTGKTLNLKKPITFNEKIQWLKVHDRNPIYTKLVDKYAVRDYVEEKIGDSYLIPILGKWDKVEDIDFSILPDQFVLKCNHDSGGIVICNDKSKLDIEETKRILSYHIKQNHYYISREWAYKDVKPCIICERFMVDEESKELRDYKIFCFNGVPRIIQVDFSRFFNHKRNFYSTGWEYLDLMVKCPNDPEHIIPRPSNLEEMLTIAKKLSQGIPEVRVDLYSVNGQTYFGEMTLYHGGGIEEFSSKDFEIQMGNWIDLNLVEGEL